MIRWTEKHIGVFFNLNGILLFTEACISIYPIIAHFFNFPGIYSVKLYDQRDLNYIIISDIDYCLYLFFLSFLCFKRIYFAFPLIFIHLMELTVPGMHFFSFKSFFYQTFNLNELHKLFCNLSENDDIASNLLAYYYLFLSFLSFIGMILIIRVLFMRNNRFYKR